MIDTQAHQPSNGAANPNLRRGGGNKGLEQAYILRDIAANHAMEVRETPAETLADKGIRARALRDLCSVWTSADDRIRIKRGRPLPGSLRPEKPAPKRRPMLDGPIED